MPSSDGLPAKFVFHMALFPMIVAMIGIAYIATKLTDAEKDTRAVRSNADDNTYSIYGFHFVHWNMHANFSAI